MHAVTAANGQSYHYDAYGNIVQRGTDTLDYDVFNKPTQIGTTTFSYGPDHARFKQVDGTRTTYYIGGGQYEEIIDNGVTTQRSHVGGYLVRSTSQGTTTLTYLHTDHLGSVEAMTDELGVVVGRMSFDPWGLRQDADWEDGNPTNGDPDYYPTTRGYTGHEMLDQVNLIHMNGRVYDPVIGRFLTPDLFIQAPHNTQSFNRYSYVLNNPLSLVDPTGYYCGGPSGGTAYNMPMQQWAYEAASFNTQMSFAMQGQRQMYQQLQQAKQYRQDMETLANFVEGNSNSGSVEELVGVYLNEGFAGVVLQAVGSLDGFNDFSMKGGH